MKNDANGHWAHIRRHKKKIVKVWNVEKQAQWRHMFKRSYRWGDYLRLKRRYRKTILMPLALKRTLEKLSTK